MPTKPKAPTIEAVTTINDDGSRYFVHPADVRGTFARSRRVVAVALIALYVSLPFIQINGQPAVFLDVLHRKLHLLGITLMFQDLWLLFFLITGLGFGLFLVTAVVGRIWCGWGCPQTVFLDHVFRRVERWIDGDAPSRRQLDAAPWSAGKGIRRLLKHTIYFFLAALIAHVFLSYFVSLPGLYEMIRQEPAKNWGTFVFVFALSSVLYFNFAWFREQFCIVLCPYGRLQSALIDDNSIVIGYDAIRGEPRGRQAASHGDCVDCRRCVQVCPTGIDIRQGLQLECIACTACIDACDEIMGKLSRPKGLIRHASLNALAGRKARFWRPRIFIYLVLCLAGASAFLFASQQVSPVILTVLRMQGAPYFRDETSIRNNFLLRLANKHADGHNFSVKVSSTQAGLVAVGTPEKTISLAPGGEVREPLILTLPDGDFRGPFDVRVQILNENGEVEAERTVPFLGPFRQQP